MRIIFDAMGGDNAPYEIVKGAVEAMKEYGTETVLVGKEEQIRAVLDKLGVKEEAPLLSIVNATEVVEMDDDPTGVLKTKKDSSMNVALTMLKNGEGDACISAGSTGALLAGATLLVKRIKGIRRAAMAPVLPNGGDGVVLIDCGANSDCTPEYLLQFAYMGSFYSKNILGCKDPRVGLLNNGTEDSKGDQLRKDTFSLLKNAGNEGHINFIGNVEASDVLQGAVDVVVTDGFTGNILLKCIEGSAKMIFSNVKDVLTGSLFSKLAALTLKKGLNGLKDTLDPSSVGGTPMLGITKPVIKAHGSSDARAIKNAVRQAINVINADVPGLIAENIDLMTLGK